MDTEGGKPESLPQMQEAVRLPAKDRGGSMMGLYAFDMPNGLTYIGRMNLFPSGVRTFYDVVKLPTKNYIDRKLNVSTDYDTIIDKMKEQHKSMKWQGHAVERIPDFRPSKALAMYVLEGD